MSRNTYTIVSLAKLCAQYAELRKMYIFSLVYYINFVVSRTRTPYALNAHKNKGRIPHLYNKSYTLIPRTQICAHCALLCKMCVSSSFYYINVTVSSAVTPCALSAHRNKVHILHLYNESYTTVLLIYFCAQCALLCKMCVSSLFSYVNSTVSSRITPCAFSALKN